MSRSHTIYLDCDGVYADFITGILDVLEYPDYDINEWSWGRVFDIFPLIGTNWKEASKHCTSDFWAGLPWMEDGKEILAEVWKRFDPADSMLLTKPMDHDGSYTGKAQWVTEHIPELRRRLVPTHINKHEFCHGFNDLLIDDSQENIEAWANAGGAGLLVPRPWNSLDSTFYAGDTVKYVAERMDTWIEISKYSARKGTACL